MPPSPSRYDLLRKRLDVFTQVFPRASRGEPRAVHRTRVASRRLREILPILQIDAGRCRRVVKDLRRVTRALGTIRELDALSGLVKDLQASVPEKAGGLSAVRDEMRRARHDSHERAMKKGLGRDLRHVAKQLRKLVEDIDGGARSRERRWRWALDARVAMRARVLVEATDRAGLDYVPTSLHEVRIALKKLRYALELVEAASGEPASVDLRRLERGQSLLGRLHDRQLLIARIGDVQVSLGSSDVHAFRELADVRSGLERDCRSLHARYLRSRTALRDICGRVLTRAAGAASTNEGSVGPAMPHASRRSAGA